MLDGWVEILMFSLVSRKFLAMRNIALYSLHEGRDQTFVLLSVSGAKQKTKTKLTKMKITKIDKWWKKKRFVRLRDELKVKMC
jgi:hypothetical protein